MFHLYSFIASSKAHLSSSCLMPISIKSSSVSVKNRSMST